MQNSLHEALQPIAWLAGRWSTQNGRGRYPNIPDFKYHEDLEFTCVGQPMFNYVSTSRHPEKGTPMHQERGFLCVEPGSERLTLVVSHNFGLTSVEEGEAMPELNEIFLETVHLARTSLANRPYVKKLRRQFQLLNENELELVVSMQTENTPMTEHLRAVYKKIQ